MAIFEMKTLKKKYLYPNTPAKVIKLPRTTIPPYVPGLFDGEENKMYQCPGSKMQIKDEK